MLVPAVQPTEINSYTAYWVCRFLLIFSTQHMCASEVRLAQSQWLVPRRIPNRPAPT